MPEARLQVLFLSTRREVADILGFHLRPIGFDVELRADPAELLAELGHAMPPVILFDADTFPRHWKAVATHVRSSQPGLEPVLLLLAGADLPPEEVAKATHLGINAIISEDITDKRGTHRLLELLRRFKLLHDKRSFTRHLVTESDRIGLALINPATGALVTGEVTEVSVKGLSFTPDHPERCSDLRAGTDLEGCSLRIGDRIVYVYCRVMRGGRDLGLQFLSFQEGAHDALRGYIQARPDRALHAAIEAGRHASARPH